MTATTDWGPLAADLVERLTAAAGAFRDQEWREAFEVTPRHMFIPRYWEQDSVGFPTTLVDGADPRQRQVWLTGVYDDRELVTSCTDSTAAGADIRLVTEVAPAPSTLAVMLDRLAANETHRVLEIGTGSGYGTALLATRCGSDNVSSVDTDHVDMPHVMRTLAAAALSPEVNAGDGFDGLPGGAPYDRIIATRAVSRVPLAWVAQLVPGGRMVVPLKCGKALAVLDKTEDGKLAGVVDRAPIEVLPLRHHDDEQTSLVHAWRASPDESGLGSRRGTTDTDPRWLDDDDVKLWVSLHVPGVEIVRALDGPRGDAVGTVVYVSADRATVGHRRIGNQLWPVIQEGQRPWDHVEAAVRTFRRAGRPARSRLGIAADADGTGQRIWLDDLDSQYSWPLPDA